MTNLVALGVTFLLTYTVGYKDQPDPAVAGSGEQGTGAAPVLEGAAVCAPLTVGAPVGGRVIPSGQIPDETFAAGILGTGVGIEPEDGTVLAPFDGVVTTVADTRHAVGVTSLDGVEVLIHIGVDTVDMNGEGFTAHVEEGQKSHKGDRLLSFDRGRIAAAGHPDIVVVQVTNGDDFSRVSIRTGPAEVLAAVIDVE